jgi:hypothetical protein
MFKFIFIPVSSILVCILSAALSTTNPTLLDPGSNPDRRCWKPATNRLSHCMAYNNITLIIN